MTRPRSEGFERLKKPRMLVGAFLAAALLWFGFALPLVSAVGIHLAISRLIRTPVGEDPRASGAIWGFAALFSLVLISCLHFALLTRGTGEILGPELLSGSFDSLAEGLLRGTSEVDPATIRWEALVVEGRSYFYFGPWPALLRVPLQWLAPERFGQWARLSCFVASTLCLAAFALIAVRMLAKNLAPSDEERRFLLVTSLLGFGLATPLIFLMNAGSIYHESILWGLAGSTCFVSVLVPRLDAPESLREKLPLLSAIAGATLLARVTFGGPLYLILILIAANELFPLARLERRDLVARTARLMLALLPAGSMLLFQLWYNFDRFGSPLTFVDYRALDFMKASPETLEILDTSGVFNLERVLTAIGNYLVPSGDIVSRQFPWFRITQPHYPDQNLYPRIFDSYLVALTAMSSWLVLGGAIGVGYLFRGAKPVLARLCFLAFLTEALLVCSYYIMEMRYQVDLIPMFIFGYGMFLAEVSARGPLRGRTKDLASGLMFAVAVSAIVSISCTLSAIPLGGPAHPSSYKADWQERFRAVDARMPE